MKDSYFPLISIFLISLCNIYSQNLPVTRGFQKFMLVNLGFPVLWNIIHSTF